MKINKNIFFVLIALVILSCKQSFLEVEKTIYKKDGMYGLIYVGNLNYDKTVKLLFAPIDSLGDYKDTGIIVPAGRDGSFPNLFYNSENNLVIICTSDYLYFIDSETHKIKKTVPFVDDNNVPAVNRYSDMIFYYHNYSYCHLLKDQIIYGIDLKEMKTEIAFDFRGVPFHYRAEISPNGRYLYKRIHPYSYEGELPNYMITTYKCDLIKKTIKLISTEPKNYFRFGVSKDYLVIMSKDEIKKYSITTDELIETKKIEIGNYPFYFYGTEKNNLLYYLTTDSLLKTINLDNYEIKDYLTMDKIVFASFLRCSDGIWVNGYGDNSTYLINLEKKEIVYTLNPKVGPYSRIMKETKKIGR